MTGLTSLQSASRTATLASKVKDQTFHDLRGTAVVMLARAGCTEAEIYAITGHKPSDIQTILTARYLPRDGEVAANAIAKLNAYPARPWRPKRGRKTPVCVATGCS